MNRRPLRGVIRPKASNIPRRKTAATAYLEAYKLAVEKERLQRELATLEDRKQQILQRLSQIDSLCDRLQSDEVIAAFGAELQENDGPLPAPPSDRFAPVKGDTDTAYRTIAIDY